MLVSGYAVVEKIFLKLKIIVATVKDTSFLIFLKVRTALREMSDKSPPHWGA